MTSSDPKGNFHKYNGQSNWTFPNIAYMVGGFVVAPPVGIATALWLALGKNVDITQTLKKTYNEYSPVAKDKYNAFKESWEHKDSGDHKSSTDPEGTSDNAAYQSYKAEKMAEYDAESKQRDADAKSEEEQFNEYMNWQKHAKDEANFKNFQKHQADEMKKAKKDK